MKQEFPKELAETIKLGDSLVANYEYDLELIIWEVILIKEKGVYYKYDLKTGLKFPCKAIREDIEDYFSYKIYNDKQILNEHNENTNIKN